MSQAAHKPAINVNLITQDEFSNSFVGKFMLWALSIGRYIVVFTELIVILSFLSRFKLDRDLTDLNEQIAHYKAIVLSYGDLESTILNVQKRTAIVKAANDGLLPSDFFTLLETTMPIDVKISQANFDQNSISIVASSLSPQGFAQFMNALTKNELVDHIEVNSIASKDQDQSINFNIVAILKNSAPIIK